MIVSMSIRVQVWRKSIRTSRFLCYTFALKNWKDCAPQLTSNVIRKLGVKSVEFRGTIDELWYTEYSLHRCDLFVIQVKSIKGQGARFFRKCTTKLRQTAFTTFTRSHYLSLMNYCYLSVKTVQLHLLKLKF